MQTRPQIDLKNRKSGEKKRYRIDQERVLVGRDHSNYIVLESRMISRRHAEIFSEGNQFFIRDLRSDNGTLLNEQRLPANEKTLLRSGDQIQIEDYELYFNLPSTSSEGDLYETTDTDLLEIKMIKKLLKAMDRENAPSLEILEGPQAGSRFVLEGKNQEIVIGRDAACEFQIESDVISRKHARLEKHFDAVLLQDLGSKNGTYVNREKIREKRLQDGDILHLGTLPLLFRNPQELSFDLSPPQVKQQERLEVPGEPETTEPIDPGSESRGVRRHGGLVEEEEIPAPVLRESKFSPAEILAIAIGLAVLLGSLWGILNILR